MQKKEYQRPTIDVVELRQQQQLLAGSPLDATRNDYGVANEDTWENN